jgi:hypothetical protein
VKFDLRRTPRLRLKRAATGYTRLGEVEIVDITPPGMGIRHDFSLEKTVALTLEFTWAGRRLKLECEVRSTREDGNGKFRSGLAIRGGPSEKEYRQLVEREIEKMKAATSQRPASV